MHKRLVVAIALAAVAGLGAAVALRHTWLRWLGAAMISNSAYQPGSVRAEALLIPNADFATSATPSQMEDLKRCVESGSAKAVFMTCPDAYGASVCELARKAGAEHGLPGIKLESIGLGRVPDRVEARIAMEHLGSLGFKTVLVLLPKHKTRRLSSVYAKEGRRFGMTVTILGSGSPEFDPATWWKSRESQKLFAHEMLRWIGW